MKQIKATPIFILLAILALTCLPGSAYASIFYEKERYTVARGDTIDDDIYLGGSEGVFDGVVTGDVIIACKDYSISGTVTGSVNSASMTSTIRGTVGNSARVFAQTIIIDGNIGGNLLAFGQDIDVSEDARIEKDANIFGNEVSFAGTITRDLSIDCNQVIISGVIDGNLNISAQKISIVAPAEIAGDIYYTSRKEIRIEDDVIIGGEIEWEEVVEGKKKDDDGIGWFMRILLLIASFVTGLFIIGIAGRHSRTSSEYVVQKPLVCLGVGFVAFCAIPVAIVVLLALIISIPVAIILLFAYTIFFYIAKIYVAIAIGRWGIRAFRKDADPKQGWSLLLGLIILTILFVIPVLGWFVYFAVIFWGIGAIILGIRACRWGLQPNGSLAAPDSTAPTAT